MEDKIRMTLLAAAEEVLGLPQDEMAENLNLDLFENGMIDSFGCVAMMTYVEEALGQKIDLSLIAPEDYISLSSMAKVLETIIK